MAKIRASLTKIKKYEKKIIMNLFQLVGQPITMKNIFPYCFWAPRAQFLTKLDEILHEGPFLALNWRNNP